VISFTLALFLLTLALISGNRDGWFDRSIILEIEGALVSFIVFLFIEIRQEHPMLDLRFFGNRTYLGANISLLAFSSCLITMLTYLPVYFQSALRYDPQKAGLLMLPMAVPFFLMPRFLSARLSFWASGRLQLTASLAVVSAGLFWMAYEAPFLHYSGMLGGMLLAGTGAGLLNGETAKVGMTALPPDRAGMASGTFGTIRYSSIVTGFAALGAVLFHTVDTRVFETSAFAALGDRHLLVHQIATSGNVAETTRDAAFNGLAIAIYGDAFRALLLAAGIFVALCAILTWMLVKASDTAPLRQNGVIKTHPASLAMDQIID
jgi:uncharacterized Zn-binding protein involved in type VI secretion